MIVDIATKDADTDNTDIDDTDADLMDSDDSPDPPAQGPTCPIVPPCPEGELAPLLEHLGADLGTAEALSFPRGTLLPDGRLDLCKQGLGPDGAARVAEVLPRQTFVKSLLLGANTLGDAGAQAVAEALPAQASLTTLFLGCNGIGRPGAEALAAGLRARPTQRGLWLKRNPLGSAGLRPIADAVARHPALRTLDLVDTDTRGPALDTLVDGLAANRSVERLFLDANGLRADDARNLARLLSESTSLRELYLDSNPLRDAGVITLVDALRRRPNQLEVLSLRSTGLTDIGFEAIASFLSTDPSLRRLNLGRGRSATIYRAPENRGGDAAASALSFALETNVHLAELGLGTRFPRGAELRKRVRRRRLEAGIDVSAPDGDLEAVRSVYRTAAPADVGSRENKPPAAPAEAPPRGPKDREHSGAEVQSASSSAHQPPVISTEDLEACARVLDQLRAQPAGFFSDTKAAWSPVRAAANRLIHAIQQESRAQKARRPKNRQPSVDRSQNVERDRRLIEGTGIRRQRARARVEGVTPEEAPATTPAPRPLARTRQCHICRAPFGELHFFYDSLCPSCATLNFAKRHRSGDFDGRIAVVTGGRVKIGHQVALKLLRSGATVHVTTRFPCSAARRFDAYPDADEWRHRLHIVGIDLRSLPAVERLAESWADELPRLDVLINNAAQTIRRPPAFYAPLMDAEERGPNALPPSAVGLLSIERSQPGAAALSQRRLLPEDAQAALFFPVEAYQEDGQPLDLRPHNSWSFEIGDVSSLELLEVHAVNAMAPFLLVRQLQDLMIRSRRSSDGRGCHIVNVSAMEGSFSRDFKSPCHPHTNMAKAALNMMTRTCAGALAERGVFMHSVDTGWVTDEQPAPIRELMRRRDGFEPPLDEIDGAARVLDPVFEDLRPGGAFWKDYRRIPW
ncbi:MAG: SDR family NAD(P)-dependent oxidoreductase [Acidobacteriota bacterium]